MTAVMTSNPSSVVEAVVVVMLPLHPQVFPRTHPFLAAQFHWIVESGPAEARDLFAGIDLPIYSSVLIATSSGANNSFSGASASPPGATASSLGASFSSLGATVTLYEVYRAAPHLELRWPCYSST